MQNKINETNLPAEQLKLPAAAPQGVIQREILEDATRAESSLESMLELECVLKRGELVADTKAGTVLYATAVSPRYLESTAPTRLSYVSALFRQWRGSLRVRLYVTKAIFQQTKLLMVFVPGVLPSELRSMSLDSLMGCQIRTVLNPDNEHVAVLDIPFVHTSNWQSVGGSIGAFGLLLLERIVVTQQSSSTIPWILTCCSPRGREQIRFRYAVPPPSSASAGDGDDDDLVPSDGGDSGVSVGSSLGRVYAVSSTNRGGNTRLVRAARNKQWLSAVQPLMGGPVPLRTGIPIMWSRCPDSRTLALRLAKLPLAPPFSYTFDADTSQKSILPYLPTINWLTGPLPNRDGGYTVSFEDWYCSGKSATEGNALWFGTSQSEIDFVVANVDGEDWKTEFDGWLVDLVYYSAKTSKVEMLVFKVSVVDDGSRMRLAYESQTEPGAFSGIGVYTGYPMQWVDDPRNYSRGPQIGAFLTRQIDRARAANLSPYFMLWTSGRSYVARAIQEWLYAPSTQSEPPRLAQGCLVAFSPSQAPGYFDLEYDATRGVFTWLFRIFSNDTESALYKVARIADCIFEFVLPLLLSYDGDAPLVDVANLRYSFEGTEGGEYVLSGGAERLVDVLPLPRRLLDPVLPLTDGAGTKVKRVGILRRALAARGVVSADKPRSRSAERSA